MWSRIPTPLRQAISAMRWMISTSPSSSPSRVVGRPSRKPMTMSSARSGARRGQRDQLEDVLRGRLLEVLDHAALAGAAPEVVVDRVGALDARRHRDAVLERVGDLLVAAHLPLPDRRDDLQVGGDRRDRRLDAHLVVALAGAAVGDGVGAVGVRGLDGQLGQQRTAEGGEQRVAALVAGVGQDRRRHVVARELLLGVHHQALHGAEVDGLLAHGVEVVGRLPEVDAERDHLGVVLVLDPLEHHRGVQAARVQQHHAMNLVRLREISGDGRCRVLLGHEEASNGWASEV